MFETPFLFVERPYLVSPPDCMPPTWCLSPPYNLSSWFTYYWLVNRLSTLVFQYYRLLLVYNIAFSILGIFLTSIFLKSADTGFNPGYLFYGKLTGYLAAVGLYHYSSSNSYFYFRNAGLSIRRLSVYSFGFDIIISSLLTLVFILLTHVAAPIKGW